MVERNLVRKATTKSKANQATFKWLKEEKAVVEAELKSLKMAYASLKHSSQSVFL